MAVDPPEDEHAYSTDHDDYDRMSELAETGMTAGVSAYARGKPADQEDTQEQERKRAEQFALNKIALDLIAVNSRISYLEQINAFIAEQLAKIEKELDEKNAEKTELEAQEHASEIAITSVTTAMTHMQTSMNLTLQQVNTAIFNEDEAYKKLSQAGIPENVIRVTRYENPDSCSEGDVQVAVYKNDKGEYYYNDPKTGQSVVITNPYQLKELKEQLDKGLKTADQLTEAEKAKLRTYDGAAARFLALREETDRLLKELQQQQTHYSDLEKRKQEEEQKQERIRERLEKVKERITELEEERGRLTAEQKRNEEELRHLRLQQKLLERALNKSVKATDSYDDQLEEVVVTAKKIQTEFDQTNDAKEAFESAYNSFWKGEDFYRDAEAKLQENNVILIQRDDNGLHVSYAVHRDEQGHFFYYDMEGYRKTVSPLEIEYQLNNGGKTIEDFKGNLTIEEADVFLRSSARDMKIALGKAEEAQKFLPEDFQTGQLPLSPMLMNILYSKSMMRPPSEEEALAYQRIFDAMNSNRAITKGNLETALAGLPQETRDEIMRTLERKNITVVEGGATFIISDNTVPGVQMDAEQRRQNEMKMYFDQRDAIGFEGMDGFSPGAMLASTETNGTAADQVSYGEGAGKLGTLDMTEHFAAVRGQPFKEDPLTADPANRLKGTTYTA